MAQKYKVFINDVPITLASKADVSNRFYTKIKRVDDLNELPVVLANLLQKKGEETVVFCDDVEIVWASLVKRFKWVEAAGGLVTNPKGQVLLIKRNGLWDLPKGKVESGETIAVAAVREVEEECCVTDLQQGNLLGHTYHTYPHKSTVVLKQTTWYAMTSQGLDDLVPQTEEGISEVKWVDPEKAKGLLASGYRSLADFFIPLL